jgi:hypothetical protein
VDSPFTEALPASSTPAHLRHLLPGQYAGVAIYRPRDRRDLKPELYAAIGKPFHLTYTCLADPDEPYAGQMMFQEQKAGALRSWLPEQDLEFVTVAPAAAVRPGVPSTTARTSSRAIQGQRPQVARAS